MIRIQNIYYMLSYAFQILTEEGYKSVSTEEFDNVAELCSAILIKGVSSQVKRGLAKDYISRREPLSALRGKVDITASIKEQTMIQNRLVCSYDDFSVNSYMNRIIRTTMEILVKNNISKSRKIQLRKLLVYFSEVEPLEVNSIDWNMRYDRNNQTYRMIIAVCYLTIKGLLQTSSDGTTKLMDFLDEQRMCRLYEKFILEYYKKEHPQLKTTSSKIQWNVDDDYNDMLPEMKSDIMLSDGEQTLVIDAKYYSHTLQKQFDKYSIHSGNIYQIYAYVKNLDKNNQGNVSGMLLYAQTDEAILPNNDYRISGNAISVKTLNLDCDFTELRAQLDGIVHNYFS